MNINPDPSSAENLPRKIKKHLDGFDGILLLLFALIAAYGAFNHELWRDEMQAWLIARDLGNPVSIIQHARYEGAPPFWHLLLLPLTLLTHNPVAMQILTWILAVATLGVLLKYAPIPRPHRLLLAINYYLVFQYGTVTRNYLPGILALFIACAMMCRPKPHPWTAALFLAIASLCSVHSLIVAVALAFGLWLAPWLATRISLIKYLPHWRPIHSRQDHSLRGLLPLCLFGIGTAVAVVVILPASDTFYGPAHNWLLDWEPSRASAVAIAFVTAHFPLPRPVNELWIPLWDTPLEPYTIGLMACGAILLWVTSVFLFSGSPRALATYLIGSLGLSIFLYTKYLGFSRHTGFLFITFALACWLSKTDTSGLTNTKSSRIRSLFIYLSLFAMLASQAITGVWVILQDARRPFSGGKQASQIIQDNGLQFVFISVYPDWAGAPISGYLRRPLFYPSATGTSSYAKWDIHRRDNLSTQEIIDVTLANAPGQIPVVLITGDPLEDEILQKHDFEFLASCLGSLTPGENYFLYVQWNGLVRNKNILR